MSFNKDFDHPNEEGDSMAFGVYFADLLDGSSRRPTNIEVSIRGFGIGLGFKKLTTHPWSAISDITIDGPSSNTSRVTATRLMTLGVVALAAKKSTSETLVIITLTSGQVTTVMFTGKSEPEVRAIFAPHLGRISKLAEAVATMNPSSIATESKTEQLKDLSELLEKGMINNQEFLVLKSEIINNSAVPIEQTQIDSAVPIEQTQIDSAVPTEPHSLIDGTYARLNRKLGFWFAYCLVACAYLFQIIGIRHEGSGIVNYFYYGFGFGLLPVLLTISATFLAVSITRAKRGHISPFGPQFIFSLILTSICLILENFARVMYSYSETNPFGESPVIVLVAITAAALAKYTFSLRNITRKIG